MRQTICGCGRLKERPDQGWCNKCRNEWARDNRKSFAELSDLEKKKFKAREFLRKNVRLGNIKKLACEICGSTNKVEAHHENYDRPLDVYWFCRQCHISWHVDKKKIAKFEAHIKAPL